MIRQKDSEPSNDVIVLDRYKWSSVFRINYFLIPIRRSENTDSRCQPFQLLHFHLTGDNIDYTPFLRLAWHFWKKKMQIFIQKI